MRNLSKAGFTAVAFFFILFSETVCAENVVFADPAFKAYIVESFDGKDGSTPDGEISEAEAVLIETINNDGELSASPHFTNLTGIENFTHLKTLNVPHHAITKLDVSSNLELTHLNCSYSPIFTLDVSKNVNLTYLACNGDSLSEIDVSGNTQLKELYCGHNRLTTLDVTKNTALIRLDCNTNKLDSLDVSKNTALTVLYCKRNQISKIDLSNNTALLELSCIDNKLSALDASNNKLLQVLYCGYNQIRTLDVSKNSQLVKFDCNNNQLTELDVSNNKKLNKLYCSYNKLKFLDASSMYVETYGDSSVYRLYCGKQNVTLDADSNETYDTLHLTLDYYDQADYWQDNLARYDYQETTNAGVAVHYNPPQQAFSAESKPQKVQVHISHGAVQLEGVTEGSLVHVYDVSGHLMQAIRIRSGMAVLKIPGDRVYMVKTDSGSFRVNVE